jgi:hypothetical protein
MNEVRFRRLDADEKPWPPINEAAGDVSINASDVRMAGDYSVSNNKNKD